MVTSNVCPSEKYPELMEAAAKTFALLTQVMKHCQEAALIGPGESLSLRPQLLGRRQWVYLSLCGRAIGVRSVLRNRMRSRL
jgi:hypothetical protein